VDLSPLCDPEIERGERSPLDLDTLPEGLPEYYASYWARWRKKEEWYDLYLPILTALAAAQESSTLDRILDWAGIEAQGRERSRLRSILKEQWRPFLAVSGEGRKRCTVSIMPQSESSSREKWNRLIFWQLKEIC